MAARIAPPEPVEETAPFHAGDRLEVLVKRAGDVTYWPAVVIEEPIYVPKAHFGRHWRLAIAIQCPSGSEIPGLLNVDYNGSGYELVGARPVPVTRAAAPEE